MPTSVIDLRRASQTAAPAAPIGQSPIRRATFMYALPPSSRIGSLISVSISSGPTTVWYGPVWNARADTSRLPSGPWMIMEPFSAANAADRSSDGSAWQSDPPMVPHLPHDGSAITRSASCRIAKCSPATGAASRSACLASAPMRSSPSAGSM